MRAACLVVGFVVLASSVEAQAPAGAATSTSTTQWGTTKTTVTAPGTLGLGATVALTASAQSLRTRPWSPRNVTKGLPEGCMERFAPPPPPAHATDLNGVALPDVCFRRTGPHHVFVIGDWGGVFNGKDRPVAPADRRSKHMPSHHRPFVIGADGQAQHNVAFQMESRSLQSKPDYILNAGDNFYWGGVLVKCGGPPGEVADPVGQWTWVYEKMYSGVGLAGKQWLGVLGNHDYGGFLYTHGWDQAIGYTWSKTASSTGRWVTPALYWKSKVIYPDFAVDYYFVDTNTFDAMHPDSDPGHNLCSRKHNLEVGATCGITGPVSIDECPLWFRRLWDAQVQWLRLGLAESTAGWQVVVTHFPPIRGWGDDIWKELAQEFGIDLIVAGHVHRQEVHYMGPENHLAPTAYIISGGGGGITSEDLPSAAGEDDQYGFMDLTLTAREIRIEAISHGGQLRRRLCVLQRLRGGARAPALRPGRSICQQLEPEPEPGPGGSPAAAPAPAPAPASAPTPVPAPETTAATAAAAPLPALAPRAAPLHPPGPAAAALSEAASETQRAFREEAAAKAKARLPLASEASEPEGQRQPKVHPDLPRRPRGVSASALTATAAAVAGETGSVAEETPLPGEYSFVGFSGPSEARRACGSGRQLARPRGPGQLQALLNAMQKAKAEGYMSSTWPENTAWLGGYWNSKDTQWVWDDGKAIQRMHWAAGQPAAGATKEPWLCLLLSGELCGSSAEVSLGVFCETRGSSQEILGAEAASDSNGSAQELLQEIAATIEGDSQNSIQVHTPLPLESAAPLHQVQEQNVLQKDSGSIPATALTSLYRRAAISKPHPFVLVVLAFLAVVCRRWSLDRRVLPASVRRSTLPNSGEQHLTLPTETTRPLMPYTELPPVCEPASSVDTA